MNVKFSRAVAAFAALVLSLQPWAAAGAKLPGIRSGAPRSTAGVRYTLHNVGAPPGFPSSTPTGFNNTGQIFGLVYSQDGRYRDDCRLWTGSSFEALPLPALTTCVGNSINDADAASGEYELVGYANLEFSYDIRAFAVIAGPTHFKRTTIYYANSPSTMLGVNAARTSVASAQFSRDTAADYIGQLYFTTTGAGRSLAPLQTPAAPNGPPIHNLVPLAIACAFGGCVINDRNQVIGYDQLTAFGGILPTLAMYTVGEPASLVHLPVSAPSTAIAGVVGLNDSGQLLYYDDALNEPVVLSTASGVRTNLPVVPATCPNGLGIPLSFNNLGEVLGAVEECGTTYYFTWDSVHGTQILNAQVPTSAYTVFPLGVNDNGQILAQLTDAAGVDYWGTLDPLPPPTARTRGRRRSGANR